MSDSPTTRPSLLARIGNAGDQEAWRQFVELYAPLVYGFGRRRGLQDADAADLTQEVLRAVAGARGRLEYDPNRGPFRRWLFTIARNKLLDLVAKQRRQVQAAGGTTAHELLEEQPDRDGEAEWDQEYEGRLFSLAAEKVRGKFEESTWQAFWLTAVEGMPAEETAKGLGISVGAVYIAKSRVLSQLKKQVEQLRGE